MDSVVKSNPFDLTLHGLDVFQNLRAGGDASRHRMKKYAVYQKVFCPFYMKFYWQYRRSLDNKIER